MYNEEKRVNIQKNKKKKTVMCGHSPLSNFVVHAESRVRLLPIKHIHSKDLNSNIMATCGGAKWLSYSTLVIASLEDLSEHRWQICRRQKCVDRQVWDIVL